MVSGRAGQFGKGAARPFTADVFYFLSPISYLLTPISYLSTDPS